VSQADVSGTPTVLMNGAPISRTPEALRTAVALLADPALGVDDGIVPGGPAEVRAARLVTRQRSGRRR
jgi:hypothetical protein